MAPISVRRCTASVIGTCEQAPVLRRGAAVGELIYLSGRIGAGNLEAALRENFGQPNTTPQLIADRSAPVPGRSRPGTETGCGTSQHAGEDQARCARGRAHSDLAENAFAVRLCESALMRRYATACIDTSDGVWSALDTIANLNACGYAVADLPYLEAGRQFCARAGLPASILFFGQCGEYELLFTIKPEQEPAFLDDAQKSGLEFHRLGELTPSGRVLRENDREVDLASLDLQARDFTGPKEYLAELLIWLGKQKSIKYRMAGREKA